MLKKIFLLLTLTIFCNTYSWVATTHCQNLRNRILAIQNQLKSLQYYAEANESAIMQYEAQLAELQQGLYDANCGLYMGG